ncbi:MAG: cytochrome bd ubiquinol oxidase subunit, partial [Chloroflexota bacterium]|nr:cytochrome bd ubiquinol oxidase subunit [Chloroflexota bacterium]
MTSVELTAITLWLGLTAYAVFGGADFGAGFWDLVAGDAHRGAAPRALVADAIGPVWEANHTWLIFDLVILWTAFPAAFAAIMSTLFVPLSLAALGIVLRGASFAFRPVLPGAPGRRAAGAVFAIS